MVDQVANFKKVTVSTGYNNTATSIVLATGQGAELPDPSGDNYNLVWWDSTNYNDPADDPNVEIVRVTAKSTDTLTITRNQESSGASNKNNADATYKMILATTAKTITDLIADVEKAATVIVGKSGHVDYLTTDYGSDDACIQAAVDYVEGLGGGHVLIREGTYSLTSGLTTDSNNICISGAGFSTILTLYNTGTMFTVEKTNGNPGYDVVYGFTLRDLYLKSGGGNTVACVTCNRTWNALIERVWIRDFAHSHAIKFMGRNDTTASPTVSDFVAYNTVNNCYSNGNLYGVITDAPNSNGICTASTISGGAFEADGIANSYGIWLKEGGSHYVNNINVENQTYGVYVNCNNCRLDHLRTESNTTAIYVSDAITGTIITAPFLASNNTTQIRYGYEPIELNMGFEQNHNNICKNGSFEYWKSGDAVHWTLQGAGASILEENSIIKYGSSSLKLTRSGANCVMKQVLSDYSRYKDKWVTVSVKVYCTTAGKAGILINDGVDTDTKYHTGTGWEFLVVNKEVDSSASDLFTSCFVYTSDVSAYFDGVMVTEGMESPAFVPHFEDYHIPAGNFTAPSVPATTVNYTNAYGFPCQVQVYGGTVTEIDMDDIATGLTSGMFIIPPGGTINITYSAAPSWRWWGL